MRTERVSIAVPYRANVVPRGARSPREVVYRTTLPVDLPVVAPGDLPVAVICRNIPARYVTDRPICEYLGWGGSLWLPMHDHDDPDLLLRTGTALRRLEDGSEDLEDGETNPFAHVGPRPVSMDAFLRARPIEDVLVKEHLADDRQTSLAHAARLASDLLLCGDGRVLRRSCGPFFASFDDRTIDLAASRFAPPGGAHHPFGPGRLAEAVECFSMLAPGRTAKVRGEVAIHDPACVPDLDALATARGVSARYWARIFDVVSDGADTDHRVAAEAAIAAAAKLRGFDRHYFVDRECSPTPQGMEMPGPQEILDAVETMRGFAEDHMFAADSPASPATLGSLRHLWERTVQPMLARWDVFERDRLPIADTPPELGLPTIGAAP